MTDCFGATSPVPNGLEQATRPRRMVCSDI
jgi:hypothetical protein